jgi:uncharacterized membrane protein YeaQ/YmgE (transglycosylase-associated protein family)
MYQGQMPMTFGLALFLMIAVVIPAIGAIAGWLAGKIMEGRGFGFLTNAGLGILGAIVASYVFGFLGIYFFGLLGVIVKATLGAIIVLDIANWFKKRRPV